MALLLNILHCHPAGATATQHKPMRSLWHTVDAEGHITLNLYVFWSLNCAHCKRAIPFVQRLQSTYNWLHIVSLELTEHPANVDRYLKMAALLGQQATSIPAFLFCEEMLVGYATASTTGQTLEQKLLRCYQRLQQGGAAATRQVTDRPALPQVVIPGLGTVDPATLSLPIMTLILAGLDAFNPCAFFVLLFLLSLLVHAHNRRRMFLIGGIFVLCSGLMYFIFMAAWLNLFLIIGHRRSVTIGAGAVAFVISLFNLKDYFWFNRGFSLRIPEQARPGLFRRMRGLVNATRLARMIVGTIGLAIIANAYELLCTAGFPMVFTRILTLEKLPASAYYAYLMFYNLVYIIPLAVIVLIFTVTLGSRKLQQEEGRRLKLLAGSMMFNLSLVLLFAPNRLENVMTVILIPVVAIALAVVMIVVERVIGRQMSRRD